MSDMLSVRRTCSVSLLAILPPPPLSIYLHALSALGANSTMVMRGGSPSRRLITQHHFAKKDFDVEIGYLQSSSSSSASTTIFKRIFKKLQKSTVPSTYEARVSSTANRQGRGRHVGVSLCFFFCKIYQINI